jgi:hypothetical protein
MAEVGETNKAENDDDHKTDNSARATISQAHPWPYLQTMFRVKSVESKTVRFVCLLCTPKVTECSAYTNSPSNLKKHVEVGYSVIVCLYLLLCHVIAYILYWV